MTVASAPDGFKPVVYSIEGRSLKLDSAADVHLFVNEIKALEGLTEIRLSGNTFGVEAAKAIAEALRDQPLLRVAGLSDMFTGRLKDEIPLALEALGDALEDKVHLVELDLSDNAFGPAGAKPLMKLLTNNRNIQILRLNNNGLGIEGGRLIAEALVAAQSKNVAESRQSSLRVIVTGRNRLESKGAEYLSEAFRAHSESLQEVRMPQNSIRPEGVQTLVRALATCKKLEHLDLQDNTFTEPGSVALAEALANWPHMRILNVGDCLLSARGGLAIIKALTGGHAKLQKLSLVFGEIDEAGAKLVPSMLANKVELVSLELNGNAFDAEGNSVKAIRDMLRSHGNPDALDELDEMEYESEEEEEEEEGEEEEDEKGEDVDELAAAVGGLKV
ncbi:hypothetical protein HK104_010081 [Borealophlyctis nickersoniae]|nr:hypothetical protein HK104_010081 [Borealophlyctis nickersoniae]